MDSDVTPPAAFSADASEQENLEINIPGGYYRDRNVKSNNPDL